FPGVKWSFEQPIEQRVNEMISGVRSDLAVKLFGDDLKILRENAEKVQKILSKMTGAKDVAVDLAGPQGVLQVKLRQRELARYGIPAKMVLDRVQALSGLHVGDV